MHSQWLGALGGIMVPAFVLLLGGGALLLWSASKSKVVPAWRFALLRRETGHAPLDRLRSLPNWKKDTEVWYAGGLSAEERWQILRSFSKLNLSITMPFAIFMGMRFVLAIGGGLLAYFLSSSQGFWVSIASSAAAAIAGWLALGMMVKFGLRQHRNAVAKAFPGALELLAICVGMGLSLEGALQRVSAEIKITSAGLSDELSLTCAEISISPNRERALLHLAERVNLLPVKAVIGTVIQSLKYGTPLAQSLRNAASEMRNRQLIELEEKASRLPAMMTVPVILFIMPSMFLIVGGPAAIKLMDMFN